jgi:hypothetical protein
MMKIATKARAPIAPHSIGLKDLNDEFTMVLSGSS